MSATARRNLFADENKGKMGPLTPTPPAAAGGGLSARSSKQAFEEAKLDNPFDHRHSDYHTSQQASLNFELRTRVERVTNEWERVVQTTRQQLELLPDKASSMNYLAYNGMCAYDEGYGCTEELPMSEERLVSEFRLACSVEVLKELQEQPAVNVGAIGSALDALVSSNKALPHLDSLLKDISPLDVAASVDAAVSAVALHEKLHYPVADKLRQELAKNVSPMLEIEERVSAAKTLKDLALENRDVAQAVACLCNQVEASNELLKLNHTRMAIVQLVAEEVEDFDKDGVALLETVRSVSDVMAKNLQAILEPIQRDLVDGKKDKELTRQQIASTAAAFAKEQADARLKFKEYEAKEMKLWKQVCDLLTDLEMTTTEKKHFVWQRLLAKEKHARQQLVEQELLKTQEAHLLRLQLCEDYIISAQRGAQQFTAFAETFDATLRAQIQKHYDDLGALQLREASEYVRRYELFAFGAEEVRAKRQSRLDIMNLSRRNLLLDIEAAAATLDPNVSKYKEDVSEIEEETEKLTQYLNYLEDMQQSRKAEVEPSTQLVSAFVTQQKHLSRKSRSGVTPASGRNTSTALGGYSSQRTSPRHGGASSAIGGDRPGSGIVTVASEATSRDGIEGLGDVSVEDAELPLLVEENEIVHPQVAARHLGLMHEENVTLRAHDYVREELAAIESRMSDIRRQKSDAMNRTDSARAGDNNKGRPAAEAPLIYIPNST